MTKADFEKIVKTRYLKDDAKIEEKTEGAKLKSVEILDVKEPFQVIIDDGCGPFTRFLQSGEGSNGIQKVCDSMLFFDEEEKLRPVFVELKSSEPYDTKEIKMKMKGSRAILCYYLKILKIFHTSDVDSMEQPYHVLLYHRDKSRKRSKRSKKSEKNQDNKELYKHPVENEGRISLRAILNN